MDFTESQEQTAFRAEAREWLAANVPEQRRPVAGAALREFDVAWQSAQFEGGWAGIAWPVEHGGRGLSLTQQMIWTEEYARADAPYAGCCYVGINHAGPTLVARGDAEQQAAHLPAILRGEEVWCQGFSEPGAGSDLAALRTRGVIDGDTLVISGQKIWTSYADCADYQELLVRTDPSEKHGGITWVICDMHTPGIEVRPIVSMARLSHFAEVFYDEVRVPLTNVVGGLGAGWSVAQTTFSFERGTGFMAEQLELARIVDRLAELGRGSARNSTDEDGVSFDERLAVLRVEVRALGAMILGLISKLETAPERGAEAMLVRIFHSELVQRVYRLAMEVLGADRLEFRRWGDTEDWTGAFLRSFHTTIGGGTTDIARNVLAERVLALPRSRN